ncbi:hypothetical protein, partial [Cetobacterium sp.]|uniref:hypothetical protein n=1 Tax=Cetobacterium sp. TaxID=2071632 RepID=UPI003F67289F
MINIFISIPIFLYSVFKKKYSSFLGALILSINAYYFIPYEGSDLDRYYKMMKTIKKINIIFRQQNDIYLELIIKKVLDMKIPHNFVAFLSCFICYYYFFKSFKLGYGLNRLKFKVYFIYFCIYFLTIPLTAFHGLRFYPAIALFTYGVMKSIKLRSKVGYIYILGSILIHTSLILPVLVYFISIILNKYSVERIKWIVYIIFIVGLIANKDI